MTIPTAVKTTTEVISEVIQDFRWHKYGLHDVEDAIYDGETEWADKLASAIYDRLIQGVPRHDDLVEDLGEISG